jgi:hypothetical protein
MYKKMIYDRNGFLANNQSLEELVGDLMGESPKQAIQNVIPV